MRAYWDIIPKISNIGNIKLNKSLIKAFLKNKIDLPYDEEDIK